MTHIPNPQIYSLITVFPKNILNTLVQILTPKHTVDGRIFVQTQQQMKTKKSQSKI